MSAVKAFLDRLVNELPTIAVGAAAILYVFGVDVSEATLTDVVEQAEAVIGIVVWLLVRANIDGPVTLAEKSGGPPKVVFVHDKEPK